MYLTQRRFEAEHQLFLQLVLRIRRYLHFITYHFQELDTMFQADTVVVGPSIQLRSAEWRRKKHQTQLDFLSESFLCGRWSARRVRYQ